MSVSFTAGDKTMTFFFGQVVPWKLGSRHGRTQQIVEYVRSAQ